MLDEVAKTWKKNGGGVIIGGENENLGSILRNIESSTVEGQTAQIVDLDHQQSVIIGAPVSSEDHQIHTESSGTLNRENSQTSLGLLALHIGDDGNDGNDGNEGDDDSQPKDLRRYFKVVQAFDHPRLWYNWAQKHFEVVGKPSSFFPDPSYKTQMFRHRYNLVHQRLLRNESFQSSTISSLRNGRSNSGPSEMVAVQQAYKLTPIANLLGRSGSNHLLLGLLTISPAGMLVIGDLSGSIALDIQHARPIPEEGAWFTPGMVVLVDGVYEEEGPSLVPAIGTDSGIGGTVGGKFIAYSVGGPPCERREVSLGISGSKTRGITSAGAGFGWVDFLGVGSERAMGVRMRKLEQVILKHSFEPIASTGRGTIVVVGELDLTKTSSLQALRRVLATYAAESSSQTPAGFVLMGNFVRYAVMAGGGSGGSIEYKEYFDSLATALSDYPTILQTATFIFVPGDNDPWASAFSAGAATILPRSGIPDVFTSRVKRAFAAANAERVSSRDRGVGGDAIWSSNPARISLFGPVQEIVLFRDDITSRLQRSALKFSPSAQESRASQQSDQIDMLSQPSSSLAEKQTIGIGDINDHDERRNSDAPLPKSIDDSTTKSSSDIFTIRKLVKTVLDQGFLSPFPISTRPVLWDHAGSLQLYPLPSALVLMDPDVPAFAVTYEGCHVMNPGPIVPQGRSGLAQWMEYNLRTRRGKIRIIRT